ncbi:hypothetical protein EOM09_07460 [bacterium]|nr:hypothetical protein [bacterium]
MKKDDYRLDDIEKALENIRCSNQGLERITMKQLEKAIKITRTPAVYNIDEIIRCLDDYIKKYEKFHDFMFCSEKELCKIIGVKKLALNQRRKRDLISYTIIGTRTIEYDIRTLLDDFKNVKNKNISIPVRLL